MSIRLSPSIRQQQVLPKHPSLCQTLEHLDFDVELLESIGQYSSPCPLNDLGCIDNPVACLHNLCTSGCQAHQFRFDYEHLPCMMATVGTLDQDGSAMAAG
jgi:hypothetical protein